MAASLASRPAGCGVGGLQPQPGPRALPRPWLPLASPWRVSRCTTCFLPGFPHTLEQGLCGLPQGSALCRAGAASLTAMPGTEAAPSRDPSYRGLPPSLCPSPPARAAPPIGLVWALSSRPSSLAGPWQCGYRGPQGEKAGARWPFWLSGSSELALVRPLLAAARRRRTCSQPCWEED